MRDVLECGGGQGKLSRLGMGPPAAPVTVPFDESLRIGSSPMPLDEWPLARTAALHEPEQIHIALAGTQYTCRFCVQRPSLS